MGSSAQESLTAALMRTAIAQGCFTVTPRERIYAFSLTGRRVAILYPPTRLVLLRPLCQDAAAVTSIRAPTCALCDSTLSSCSAPGRCSSRRTFGTNPVALGSSSHSSSHSAHKSQQSLKHTESQSPYFEEFSDHPRNLEELVLLPLLQSHQSPGRLLRVLRVGEDAPYSLLRLHVACFLEESHQRVLVDVLKDVGHGLLSVRRGELVAVDRRADPAAFVGGVGRHVFRVSLCGSNSAGVSCEAPLSSLSLSLSGQSRRWEYL